MKYSQAGQDIFALNILNDNAPHTFVDIGCWLPDQLNNTMLLEENDWVGISLDITDLKNEWSIRKTPFIQANALTSDYGKLFTDFNLPKIIDYLNLDIEGNGSRFEALKKVFEADVEFKIITIEHDAYRGYGLNERDPQRKFLLGKGYVLVCSNVCLTNNPFEDWWVNPKYVSKDKYDYLICDNVEYDEIIKNLK
jgi:hypothetical protein